MQPTLFLLFPLFLQYACPQWTTLNSLPNSGVRVGGRAIIHPVSGDFVLIAGDTSPGSSTNQILKYSLSSSAWSVISPTVSTPTARFLTFSGLDPVSGNLFIWGGYDSSGGVELDDMWKFSFSSLNWAQVSQPTTRPSGRDGGAFGVHPTTGELIIYGGDSGTAYKKDLWKYNFGTNVWTSLSTGATGMTGKYYCSGTFEKQSNDFIVYGGILSSTGIPTSDFWRWSFSSNTWTKITPSNSGPAERLAPSLHTDPGSGDILLFAGSGVNNAQNDFWRYSFTSNAWTQIAGTNPPVRYLHAFAQDSTGNFYAMGGYDGTNPLGDFYKFHLDQLSSSSAARSPSSSSSTTGSSAIPSSSVIIAASSSSSVPSSAISSVTSSFVIQDAGTTSSLSAPFETTVNDFPSSWSFSLASSTSDTLTILTLDQVSPASVSSESSTSPYATEYVGETVGPVIEIYGKNRAHSSSSSSTYRADSVAEKSSGIFAHVTKTQFLIFVACLGALVLAFTGGCIVMLTRRKKLSNSSSDIVSKNYLNKTGTTASVSSLSTQSFTKQSTNSAFDLSQYSTFPESATAMNNFNTLVATEVAQNFVLALPGYLEIDFNNFVRMGKEVSKGAQGTVHIADLLDDRFAVYGRTVVVKQWINADRDREMFQQEVSILHFLRSHRNIAKIIGFSQNPMAMIMKNYPYGALDSFFKDGRNFKSKALLCSFMKDIANGIAGIHLNGFAHCDLKLSNILVDLDPATGRFYCAITDFGISQIINHQNLMVHAFVHVHVNGGSMSYMSPETIQQWRRRDLIPVSLIPARDIYAFAVIMNELICRKRVRVWGPKTSY